MSELSLLALNSVDLISNAMLRHKGFDTHVVDKARELILKSNKKTVLDIGANLGSFCLPLAKEFPTHKFVAFEPQRIVYYQLCGNMVFNNIHNIYAHNYGLASYFNKIEAVMPDYKTETNIGAFSLDEEVISHSDYLCKTQGATEYIELRPLDSLHLNDVALIKVDVEGMEIDVLKGGFDTIRNNDFPPILFECWTDKEWFKPRRDELFEFIQSLGYSIEGSKHDNYFAIYEGGEK